MKPNQNQLYTIYKIFTYNTGTKKKWKVKDRGKLPVVGILAKMFPGSWSFIQRTENQGPHRCAEAAR